MIKKILVINNESIFIKRLIKCIENLSSKKCKFVTEVVHFSKISNSMDIKEFSGIVLSGGPHDTHGNKEMDPERELIKTAKIPIFGICFGMQLISMMNQGKIKPLPKERHGINKIRMLPSSREDTIFDGIPEEFTVMKTHKWAITRVGKGLKVLCEGEDGIEIIKHRGKKIYGVEFHPEAGPRNHGTLIIRNFLYQL